MIYQKLIWDMTRNQVYMGLKEHERRVWSVDFSWSNPTLVASRSDGGSIKLWNINQGTRVGTIKTKANVCCVQFSFDLGNTSVFGHNKTVSYVKVLDSSNLILSSTDNTLKLWDLSESTPQVIDSPVQTFTGHMNIKNFVGLSISNGYIATSSEKNETTDPISGDEVDDSDQFISSVCWRVQSPTLLASNSIGNIKLLDMA